MISFSLGMLLSVLGSMLVRKLLRKRSPASFPGPILPKERPLEDRLGPELSARRRAWALRMEVEEMCNRVAEGRAP